MAIDGIRNNSTNTDYKCLHDFPRVKEMRLKLNELSENRWLIDVNYYHQLDGNVN